jgi:hypothetical protein
MVRHLPFVAVNIFIFGELLGEALCSSIYGVMRVTVGK